MLLHAFPLFSTSSSSFTVRGPLWGTSGCNFACLFARSFCLLVSLANCRLFGDFLNVLFGENNRKVGFKITFNPPGEGDCFFGSSGQQLGQLEIESQNFGGLSFD